jgi:hypothetical protein
MKSRHTPVSGSLTRSFGIEGFNDLVVELKSDGQVIFRKEPVDRKIKRGEQLPERRLNVREVMGDLGNRPTKELEVTSIIEALMAKAPIAQFEGDTPRNVSYSMKVWLLKELKQIINPEETCSDLE